MNQGPLIRELNHTYKEMDDFYHQYANDIGLSFSAFLIYYGISLLGEGCLQKDICELVFISKQTINSSIRNLEQEGCLSLVHGHGRELHIHLTEKGKQISDTKVLPIVQWEQEALMKMTPEERRLLVSLTRTYLDHLKQNSLSETEEQK